MRPSTASCILLTTYTVVIYLFLVLEAVMFNFSKHMHTASGYALVVITMLILAIPPVSLQVAVVTHVYARAQQQWVEDEERLAEAVAAAATRSSRNQLREPSQASILGAEPGEAGERQRRAIQDELAERDELTDPAAASTATAAEERGVPEPERIAPSPSPSNLTPEERVQARRQLAQLLGTSRWMDMGRLSQAGGADLGSATAAVGGDGVDV